MKAYLDILEHIHETGKLGPNRTGVNTQSVFGTVFRHDLADGFPLLTTKKVNLRAALAEMFAFFKGATSIQEFQELGCGLWDAWALPEDYYRLRYGSREELTQKLSDKQGIEYSDAESIIAKITTDLEEWSIREQEAVQAASTESAQDSIIIESDINDDAARHHKESMIALSEWMVNNPQPPTVESYLASEGIDLYVKEIIANKGDLGPIYGKQWTEWKTESGQPINQLENVYWSLRNDPYDRRMLICGWNPEYIQFKKLDVDVRNFEMRTSEERVHDNIRRGLMSLPPCHLMSMFKVTPAIADPTKKVCLPRLNMSVIMRSSDVPVGLPFNIAGYAAYLMIMAKEVNMEPGELIVFSNDAHFYTNQIEGVETQLARTPKQLPTLTIPDGISLLDKDTLTVENIDRIMEGLKGYYPEPFIKFPVAV